MAILIGRSTELQYLEQYYLSTKAEFLAIYGRRRVGKTYMINYYFQDKGIYFEITGSKNTPLKIQLENFQEEYAGLFGKESIEKTPNSWNKAFFNLINQLKKISKEKKIILFIDELPWLASPRSNFLSALEYAWNRHLSRIPNLLLIVCGSAASWMLNNVVNNEDGLYGRLSATIKLMPFDLKVTEEFLLSKNVQLPRKQLVELYMAIGGVAKYLDFVEPGKSIPQILNKLYFSTQGQLFIEFDKLFESLFDKAINHIAIVRQLSKKRYGMLQQDLLDTSGLAQSGRISRVLEELLASGFIISVPMYGKTIQNRKFRLADEFSYFYLRWVEPNRNSILHMTNKNYWDKIYHSQSWQAWSGYAFETICIKHISKIKKALGIKAVNTQESHWFHIGDENNHGTVIDLVMERADHCIHLFEIKFCNDIFSITKQYAEKLERKRQLFMHHTKTTKAVFITLITPYGAKENNYYNQVVQQQLTLDDLFH